jgi:hypothetical protein
VPVHAARQAIAWLRAVRVPVCFVIPHLADEHFFPMQLLENLSYTSLGRCDTLKIWRQTNDAAQQFSLTKKK